jgi:hypothetical protein
MNIRFIPREEIDPARWNGCVYYAHNSRPYAYTWYLDNVAEQWDGLVEGEYESVFPLVWKRKWGISYLYQPLLCQQLGLFSVNVCSQARLKAFLEAVPAEFQWWDIQLNSRNSGLNHFKHGYLLQSRPNYVLDLSPDYETLHRQYSKNLQRNLKKAEQEGLIFLPGMLSFEEFIDLVRQYHQDKANPIPEALYHTALRIMYNAQHRGQGGLFTVFTPEKELCAAAFLLYGGNRMINLLNVSTELGRQLNGMAYLFDSLIQQQAGQRRLLDFEGSKIEGIARFYQSFGAEDEPYWHLQRNALPWYLRWAKR